MDKQTYYKLQNGSDVRGIALEGVEGQNVNFTKEIVEEIAVGFVTYLTKKLGKEPKQLKISVGQDSRLSGDDLKAGIMQGIQSVGAMVYDCQLASTPSIFMSTVLEGFMYDGGIMITASHLPFNRNGMKFFTNEGGLESRDIREILDLVVTGDLLEYLDKSNQFPTEKAELIKGYSAHLCEIIKKDVQGTDYDRPLAGLHIVVDASNGAGGFFATQVLEPLGADTSGSIYLNPDGTFPNHVPNPENKKAMEAIKKATVDNRADLGIIFDTDVDRAAAVLSTGQEINRNGLIGLMAAILAETYPTTTIVTDSVTSNHLTTFIEESLHLKHHRFKRGYRNVINEAMRLNNEGIDSQLAIETSGHGALKENYFLDDGAYISVKILCELAKCKKEGQSLETLITDLKEPKESEEYRISILQEDFKDYGKKVLTAFEEFVKQIKEFEVEKVNFEGIRVEVKGEGNTGWLLLRMSLHDPLLPLNIESDCEGGVLKILDILRPFFAQFNQLGGF